MEAAAAAAAAAVRGGSLARARAAYVCARGPRHVVVAGLAAPSRRRVLVAVAALPEALEPLVSRAQEGAVEADDEVEELEVHGDAAAAEDDDGTSSPTGAPAKTVRVRFVLKKQCPFGQSFHLVGDDAALGLWDPANAVPLQWVEGHEWIVEKDLPSNKLIEFKFLLRDTSGKLQWQNGPNRSLQTGETGSALVVYEDWDDMKNQKIEEEGEASIGMQTGETVSALVVYEDWDDVKNQKIEEEGEASIGMQTGETVSALVVYEDWEDVKNQKTEEEGEASIGMQAGETVSALVVYEDWDDVKNQKTEEEGEASIGMEGTVVEDDNDSIEDDVEDELQMDDSKEVKLEEPIVPEYDEKSVLATNDSDQGDSPKPFPHEELKMLGPLYEKEDEENGYTSFADASYAEKTAEESILADDGVRVENDLTNAEHDFLWGWKTLQELLLNLGFKMDAS